MDFEVMKDDLRQTRFAEPEPPELEPGQALLAIDRFGLTANNITYAVFGDAMNYWEFFPAEEGWGRVPVWGFADVVASRHDGLGEGARIYGYLPPSTQLVVMPDRAGPAGFVDAAPHRAGKASAYNSYLRVDADPGHDPAREDEQMLLRPLFYTSFLIDDFLDENGLFGARTVALSSASSKTALGVAFLLSRRQGVELVGLTSVRSAGFVEGLDLYDRVVAYEDLSSLPRTPTAYIDMAGDAALRAAIHEHYGDELAHSAVVGATHWDAMAGTGDLPGPRPKFFFAPDRISKRTGDWGHDGLAARYAAAWKPFVEWTVGWLEVINGRGPEALERVYLDLLEGRIDPSKAHVLSLQA